MKELQRTYSDYTLGTEELQRFDRNYKDLRDRRGITGEL